MKTILTLLCWTGFVLPAYGALGEYRELPSRSNRSATGNVASQKMTTAQTAGADNYEIETVEVNSVPVKEYISLDGQVFAVRWSGPVAPSLRSILGESYSTYHDAPTSARKRMIRRSMVVRTTDLVVRHQGLMGSYSGFAYLPARVPAGVHPETLP